MKKAIIGVVLFLVIGCGSQKDPIEKYVKEDIVLEVGSKININSVIDVDKVDNEELKKSIEKATIGINYKDNEKIDGEIGKDKVFATNNVQLKYEYEDKEYEKDVEVKIKDTKKPKLSVPITYVYTKLNKEKTEEQMIKDIKVKVSDNGEYKIKLVDFDKIDFTKIQENKITVSVSDDAKNTVKKDIIIFVGEPPVSFKFNVESYIDYDDNYYLHLFIPSTITSRYNIELFSYQNIYSALKFTNDNEEIKLYNWVFLEHNGYKKVKRYKFNDAEISILKPAKTFTGGRKNKDYGKGANMSTFKYRKHYTETISIVSIFVEKGENLNQIEWFTNEIVANSYVYK